MGLLDLINKHSRKLEVKSKAVPFHFEVHGDSFFIGIESIVDKGAVFDLFFKGVKKLRGKSCFSGVDDLPVSYKADGKQLKVLESLVVNKRFIEDVLKQVKKDIPTFKIISNGLSELTWSEFSKDKYKQYIKISGICYYEE